MFNMSNVADKLSSDSKNIKLDTTVNPLEIQADIMKKTGKCQKSFLGSYTQNYQPQTPYGTYYNQAPNQYPSVQIPPQAYQGQYVYNYQNWQQPNVQNAYAMQQQAYNQQMAQTPQMQPAQGQWQMQEQGAPVTNPIAY